MKVFILNYLSDCSESGSVPYEMPVLIAKTEEEAWEEIKQEFELWCEQHGYKVDDIPEDEEGNMSFTELFFHKTAKSFTLCDFGDFHIWNIHEMEFNI